MTYWVYILQSETSGRYYIGHTDNLARRLTEHNDPRIYGIQDDQAVQGALGGDMDTGGRDALRGDDIGKADKTQRRGSVLQWAQSVKMQRLHFREMQLLRKH